MTRSRVALLACTNVIGGHEFQAAALAKSLAEHLPVTVFVNHLEHAKLFQSVGLEVRIVEGVLLEPGHLPKQFLNGWLHRTEIRSLVEGFDHVIVSAGAVEAGVAVGVALRNYISTSMYLPFFFDRVPVWGWKGHIYNCILGSTCRLFDRIITINRIQARVIRAFSGVSTYIVSNLIRQVQPAVEQGPPRLVFVGRLDHQKRVDELLSWLDADSNPVKELLLIGDGPLRTLLENQAKNLTHLRCRFFGWASPEDQDRLIRSSDILVLNSLLEGEPLVIREGRARGMRIFVRDIVGTRGVTTRNERFGSKKELLDRLTCLELKVSLSKGTLTSEKTILAEKKRNRSISNLIYEIL